MNSNSKITPIQALTGMNDLLPNDYPYWQFFESCAHRVLKQYDYQQIATPILEQTQLFKRSIGEVTDIVGKEMYSFIDSMNGEQLTLRPENTASVVRAVIEHNLLYDGYKRLWYIGPMFRHEKPQRGRYRQFHQLGVEFLGVAGPEADVEVILLSKALIDQLGIQQTQLEINTLGQLDERISYRQALVRYFEQHATHLDEDSQRRLHTNPLRILDSKNKEMQSIIQNAPKLIDYLGSESLAHFDKVRDWLASCGIECILNPRLVRGLDYYNHTVFEWTTTQLGSQGTIAGGGRYDPLIAQLGGKDAPACGWAMGIERAIELIKQVQILKATPPNIYLVNAGDVQATCLQVAQKLRQAGLSVNLHCGNHSFKSQMKRADASGAPIAVIIGENEQTNGQAVVKFLRDVPSLATNTTNQVKLEATAQNQQVVSLEDLTTFLCNHFLTT